jgi:choline-sulfatase
MKKIKNPSRRRFLKTSSAVTAAGTLGMPFATPSTELSTSSLRESKGGRPNILLLLVDEMRYPPIYEADGAKQFRQQYLLAQNVLRANGVEFHRHYTASTACSPSRASLFTGHYPSLHGVSNTTGGAKGAHDPDMFWLDPGSVPTLGDYFKTAGYRTFYKGKWHISEADLDIPGTHNQYVSYDDQGNRDLEREQKYIEAARLSKYGFDGWVGPEPHGSSPLNSGSSPATGQGRDIGFAAQSVELIEQLDRDNNDDPWFIVSSFVNPHDIALWGFFARASGLFNFSVEDVVPHFTELFDPAQFLQSLVDNLDLKPSCQRSYQESYSEWMQGIPPHDYFRFYYQLHKNVDAEMMKVYKALRESRFFDDTLIVFTSDHGDLLGSHHYMHQKFYQAYDEALRVPLIISNPHLIPEPRSIHSVTSHVDLLPTLLGLAKENPKKLFKKVSVGHTDTVRPVGRDLKKLVLGRVPSVSDPIYFMSDDDASRGLNQENIYGIAYDSVIQPNHIEAIIVEINGDVWKFCRYFDNQQFWTDPAPIIGPAKDVVVTVDDTPIDVPGEYTVPATKRVKIDPAPDEYEMYNVSQDPMELNNLAGNPEYADMQYQLMSILDAQREEKRLSPVSGDVPGQPV